MLGRLMPTTSPFSNPFCNEHVGEAVGVAVEVGKADLGAHVRQGRLVGIVPEGGAHGIHVRNFPIRRIQILDVSVIGLFPEACLVHAVLLGPMVSSSPRALGRGVAAGPI